MRSLNRRHKLPLRLTSFIGRETELADVQRLLTMSRLLTLTGAPGVGKTRLALEVGARLVDDYADGVCFVALAPVIDPTLVPNAVASALGVTDQSSQGIEVVLAEHLRTRQLLLILDNCEHVALRSATLVYHLLQTCPHLSILATSRESLATDGEVTWTVPSLTRPGPADPTYIDQLSQYESVRLFADRAAAVQPGFALNEQNAPAVAGICHRLEGIALAIELAAARVRALTAQQIADRLDERFRLLVGANRTALPHHRTLRALVDWSHELLSESERLFLRRVSVFAGGWTLEAAEQVCAGDGVAREDILDLLDRLVDKSLVQMSEQDGTARYRLLEMIREYGRERLDRAGETAAICARHVDWVRTLAETARPHLTGPEQPVWLNRLETELNNIRAALGRALSDPHHTELAQWIVGRLTRFWHTQGHLDEGRRWAESALNADTGGPSRARASALNTLGNLTRNLGDYATAFAAFDEFRSIADALGAHDLLAWALYGLGTVVRFQGDDDASMRYLEMSLPLQRKAGDVYGIAVTLGTIAVMLRRRGERDRAEEMMLEAQVLSRQVGDVWAMAQTYAHLGVIAHERGDLDRAAEQLRAGMALHAELGNLHDVAWVRNKLAYLALDRGDLEEARTLYAESLVAYREQGSLWGVTESLEGLASTLVRSTRWESASRLYGAARALRDTAGFAESPTEQVDHARDVAAARVALGETRFAAAWHDGLALKFDDACDVAREAARFDPAPAVVARPSVSGQTGGSPLSAREVQVAVQIARGLTNRQIAKVLILSERTVDAHVRHIFDKLGFTSRAQVAAWAIHHGHTALKAPE